MKTTVELPDELLIAAKQRAAALRKPLRALVEQGLRTVLEVGAPPARPKRMTKWAVAEGVALPETADREATYAWLEKRLEAKLSRDAPQTTATEALSDLHKILDDAEGAAWLRDATRDDRPLSREARDPWA